MAREPIQRGKGNKMTQAKVILKKWRTRIAKAKKRGRFTDYDHELSLNWAKCAVGERDCMCEKVIPKNPTVIASPSWHRESEQNLERSSIVTRKMYVKVSKLGSDFHTHVSSNSFDKALDVIKTIESLPKEKFYR